MKKLIAVCGSDEGDTTLSSNALKTAEQVGELIAQHNGILLCGGRGGVMKAVCKGAKDGNGTTIGILPGAKSEVNEYVDIAIPTNLGNLRNYLLINAADAVIAIGGRWGTLNEISIAMIHQKPLILVKGTGGCVDDIISNEVMQDVQSIYYVVDSAEDAVKKAFNL